MDVQISQLIAQINGMEGLVTTSSCAGRVAVFVEGQKGMLKGQGGGEDEGEMEVDGIGIGIGMGKEGVLVEEKGGRGAGKGPGGKGGGYWTFVSHERIPVAKVEEGDGEREDGRRVFAEVLGLRRTKRGQEQKMRSNRVGYGYGDGDGDVKSPGGLRLARLSFSPLILHILCATLPHTRPVLVAAMNAGFRESGVQSLRILDDPEAGVMVGVRTNGLAFETVVGYVEEEDGEEVVRCCVSEEYLQMCVGIVNERFGWNEERRERFMRELERAVQGEKKEGWEDAETRRVRKREEGLRKQMIVKRRKDREEDGEDGGLGDGLNLELG